MVNNCVLREIQNDSKEMKMGNSDQISGSHDKNDCLFKNLKLIDQKHH